MNLLPLFSSAGIDCFFLENKKFTCLSGPTKGEVDLSFLKEQALGIQRKIEGGEEELRGEFSLLSLSPSKIEAFFLVGIQKEEKTFFIGKKIDLVLEIPNLPELDSILSGEEREFLSLLLNDLENEEIGKRLKKSTRSIQDSQSAIMKKLQGKSRIDLFWKAASMAVPLMKNQVK